MTCLDITLPTLAENLALDEALLLDAEAGRGGECLRLWEASQPGIVLGISGQVAAEVREENCGAVPILRRSSGGGAVVLGPGCLCYALILNYEQAEELRQIGCSYCTILGKLAAALADIAPGIAPAGTSDLAVAGRKVAGCSQQRKRRYLLHHGTLLYDLDLASVGQYLRQPPRQPDYRQDRPHEQFIANLPADGPALRQRLRAAWSAAEPSTDWPADRVRQLVAEKYGQRAWNYRR